jgi:hypothetical protein
MADTRLYPCTDASLASLAGLLASHGVTVDLTRAGEAKDGGWDISWTFPDPAHISIAVVKHPFAEEGAFWNELGKILI